MRWKPHVRFGGRPGETDHQKRWHGAPGRSHLAGDALDCCRQRVQQDLLAFSHFPQAHWRKIWSTNPLERLNGEIKRRTNVVGLFPNDAAALRLITAVIVETHDEWQIAERRYLSEESMAALTTTRQTEPLVLSEQPLAVTA